MAGARRLGGISYLDAGLREFLEHWEVEAYRREESLAGTFDRPVKHGGRFTDEQGTAMACAEKPEVAWRSGKDRGEPGGKPLWT